MAFHFPTIQYLREDAIALGCATKASMLNLVRWSIDAKEAAKDNPERYFHDDHWWMQDGLAGWNRHFPWMCERTIRRYLDEMVKEGFLIRRVVTNPRGLQPAFYRLGPVAIEIGEHISRPFKSRKKDEVVPNDKLSLPSGQIVITPPGQIVTTLMTDCHNLTKNHLKSFPNKNEEEASPPSPRLPDNIALPIRRVHELIRKPMDTEDWASWIKALSIELRLDSAEIASCAEDWLVKETEAEPSRRTKSPKLTFKRWLTNLARDKSSERHNPSRKSSKPQYAAKPETDWAEFARQVAENPELGEFGGKPRTKGREEMGGDSFTGRAG